MKQQVLGLFSSRVIATIIQAATFIVLARLLKVHELGLVGVITSAGAFAAMFTDLGVSNLISKSRALGNNVLVRSGLRLNDISAAAVGIVGCILILFVSGLSIQSLALGVLFIALLFERNAETSLSVHYADGNSASPAVSIIGRRVTAAIALIVLLVFRVGALEAYCLAQLLGASFGFAHKSFAERRHVTGEVELVGIRAIVRGSWPFWLSAVSTQARVLDTALVGALLGSYAAGVYSAAMKIVNPLNLFPVAIASIMLPHATRANPQAVGRLTRNVVLLFLSMYLFLIGPILFSHQIIVFILGEAYRDSGTIFALALAALPLLGLVSPLASILQGRGGERFVAYNGMAFGGIILVAVVILALLLGPAGAVIAIGATCLIRSITLIFAISRLATRSTTTSEVETFRNGSEAS